MKHGKSRWFILGIVCSITFVGGSLTYPKLSFAFVGSGQLTFARQVIIGGNNAVSGQTVFNGNKIEVRNGGTAAISLGKQGRLELGADSKLALRIEGDSIGGVLASGCLTINASAGEIIKIDTPNGSITSPGNQSSFFILEVKDDTTSVSSNLGEIKVTADGESETANPGEAILLKAEVNGRNSLRRLSKTEFNAVYLCDVISIPHSGDSLRTKGSHISGSSSLLSLFITVLDDATSLLFGAAVDRPGASPSTNGSGLTCINTDGLFCKPTGPTTP